MSGRSSGLALGGHASGLHNKRLKLPAGTGSMSDDAKL